MPESTESQTVSISLKQLRSTLSQLTDPDCKLCPLNEETERVCIPVNMPTRALKKDGQQLRMLVVGEAPGYSEEQTGQLFSGAAGQLLDRVLGEVDLKREWFFVTNAVKCRPAENRAPTPGEIKTCVSSYLIDELQAIRPHYGLLLGNGACQAVLGKKGITALNGQVVERHGVTWVPAFHPAAVLRNPRYMRPFKGALLTFARLIRDEEGLPVTQSKLVNSKELLKELIDQIKGSKIASVDIESWSKHPSVGRFKGGGLAWWDSTWKLCTINFSTKEGYAYVLPLWHERSPWKDPQKVVDIIKPYMESIPEWVMHNGKYDSKCLWRVGINVIHGFDTMGAEYALDENNIKDLGFLSKVYLGAADYKDMVNKGNIYFEDLDALNEYGGRDADYTYRLKKPIQRRLKKDWLSDRLYRKLLLPADRVLAHVEYRGMPLDADKLAERASECAEWVAVQEEKVYDLSGWEFNINSTTQLADVLYNHMGFPILELTSTKKASTREGVLLRLKGLDDTGIMDEILEYRRVAGYLSRYFNPYPKLVDDDWRLHPHFKPFHTVTGRLSCEAPNLQQVPRNTFVRGLFGGRDGWSVLEADYSQAEMRLAAHYSQDKTLLRIFNSNRDVHLEMAMSITGKTAEEITPEERKMAKSVNFGFLYGMGWRKFITYAAENYELDVSEAQAKKYRRQFFQDYRQLQGWHARQRGKAEKDGMVMSSIGRKRRLHDAFSSNQSVREEAMRQAINSPVQSLASDMMLFAMIQLEERLPEKEAHLISTVHDSILFEIREDKVEKWAPVIKETMETLPLEEEFECLLTVPIVVDLKYGRYWSEGASKL